MSASPCGCGGASTRAAPSRGCGCDDQGPRPVPGDCECRGPERCGVPCLERPLFSAGQLLTADALRLGQRYVEERFALRRYVDGVGVVCGLHVRCDPENPGWVIVDPGYAVACCGGDLVVCEPVRLDLCAAIAACRLPVDPCGGGPIEAPAEEGPVRLDAVEPSEETASRSAVVLGRVTDAATGSPIAGATLRIEGTSASAVTDAGGRYRIDTAGQGHQSDLRAEAGGYRAAVRAVAARPGTVTRAEFALTARGTSATEEPPARLRTFVLRAEPAWEGRDPVPVVTQRGSCDPRPECRPSREAASVRLCVEPLAEVSAEERSKERTAEFRRQGRRLFERLAYALQVSAGSGPNDRARAVIDALLRFLHDDPAPSACGVRALLCALRDALPPDQERDGGVFEADGGARGRALASRGAAPGTAVCEVPQALLRNPGGFLAAVVGNLVDGLREAYLAPGCDDCCDRAGVRLAHVVVDERLAACGGAGCYIVGIDTHAPGREALLPRSGWWRADRVSLYDAYFRGADEAGVLLSARGLFVTERDVSNGDVSPDLPDRVEEWLTQFGGETEVRRLGLYQVSDLWAPWGSEATMWTVEGRVVSIEVRRYPAAGNYLKYDASRYLARPIAMASREPSPAAGKTIVPDPREKPSATAPAPAPAGGAADASALDPAPFKEAIDGIGAKTEAQLYRAGIRTFGALAKLGYEEARKVVSGRVPLTQEQYESIVRQARAIASGEREVPVQWGTDARARLAALEGRTA
ncbi:MAG TPA: carboxypeptidase-like regulatory domain-containing protein [Longimicrobium sp.]|nr:carboxypeptidase-like regulatory domain-containing protein [Longimicrobium sp.]